MTIAIVFAVVVAGALLAIGAIYRARHLEQVAKVSDEDIAGYLYAPGAEPTAAEATERNERFVTVSPRVAALAAAGVIGTDDLHKMNRPQRRALDRSLRGKGR